MHGQYFLFFFIEFCDLCQLFISFWGLEFTLCQDSTRVSLFGSHFNKFYFLNAPNQKLLLVNCYFIQICTRIFKMINLGACNGHGH